MWDYKYYLLVLKEGWHASVVFFGYPHESTFEVNIAQTFSKICHVLWQSLLIFLKFLLLLFWFMLV